VNFARGTGAIPASDLGQRRNGVAGGSKPGEPASNALKTTINLRSVLGRGLFRQYQRIAGGDGGVLETFKHAYLLRNIGER